MPDDPPWPEPFREETDQLRVGHYAWLRQESQLEDQHRFAEAAALYLQETKINPTARAYARAGFNLAKTGDYEQALQYLRQAVQRNPNNAHAHFLFAFTLFVRAETEWKRSANSPQAREWFRASVEQARRGKRRRPPAGTRSWLRHNIQAGQKSRCPSLSVTPIRAGLVYPSRWFPVLPRTLTT